MAEPRPDKYVTHDEFKESIDRIELAQSSMASDIKRLLQASTAQEASKGRIEARYIVTLIVSLITMMIGSGGFAMLLVGGVWALAIAPYNERISGNESAVSELSHSMDRIPLLIEEMEGQINTQDVVRNLEWQHHIMMHEAIGSEVPARTYYPHIARPKSMLDAND